MTDLETEEAYSGAACDPETEQEIIDCLSVGLSRRKAANAAGVTLDALSDWCQEDKEFSLRLLQAEARAEKFAAQQLRERMSKGNSAAAIYWLKCHGGEEWREPLIADPMDSSEEVRILLKMIAAMERSMGVAGGEGAVLLPRDGPQKSKSNGDGPDS